jgi:hypothetical protein
MIRVPASSSSESQARNVCIIEADKTQHSFLYSIKICLEYYIATTTTFFLSPLSGVDPNNNFTRTG